MHFQVLKQNLCIFSTNKKSTNNVQLDIIKYSTNVPKIKITSNPIPLFSLKCMNEPETKKTEFYGKMCVEIHVHVWIKYRHFYDKNAKSICKTSQKK